MFSLSKSYLISVFLQRCLRCLHSSVVGADTYITAYLLWDTIVIELLSWVSGGFASSEFSAFILTQKVHISES